MTTWNAGDLIGVAPPFPVVSLEGLFDRNPPGLPKHGFPKEKGKNLRTIFNHLLQLSSLKVLSPLYTPEPPKTLGRLSERILQMNG